MRQYTSCKGTVSDAPTMLDVADADGVKTSATHSILSIDKPYVMMLAATALGVYVIH